MKLKNLSIQTKTQIAPVLGCIVAIIIGVVFYSTFQDVTKTRAQSKKMMEIADRVNHSILGIGKLNIKVNEIIVLQQSNVGDKKVDEAIDSAKKNNRRK